MCTVLLQPGGYATAVKYIIFARYTKNASGCTARLKRDGTRADTRFSLSAKRTSPFKSAEGRQFSRGVRISGSSAGYTMF